MRSLAWIAAVSFLCTTVASVPSTANAADGWEYLVEPYFLAPYMDGTAGVHGATGEVSADPGDVFDHLRFGAMLYLEARSANWAASIDGLYMDLRGSQESFFGGTIDVGVQQLGLFYMGYRRIAPWAEVTAGAGINSISASVSGSGPFGLEVDGREVWVDPHVGLRLGNRGDGKWRWTFLGTLGGFGVGSDFAWQAYPQIGFRATELVELTAAYRAMSLDYEDGPEGDQVVYDVITFGPQLGVRIHL